MPGQDRTGQALFATLLLNAIPHVAGDNPPYNHSQHVFSVSQ